MRRDEYNQGANLKIAAVVIGIFIVGAILIGGLFVFALGDDDSQQSNGFWADLSASADNLVKPATNTIVEGTNTLPSDIKVTEPVSTENIVVSQPVSTTVNPDAVDIHVMSVGQADAILISHNGEAVMVDAGKSMKNSEKSTLEISQHVAEFDNIKWLLTTHQDYDHIGNALYVLKKVPTGIFYDNGNTHTSQTYSDLITYLNNNSNTTVYKTAQVGDDISPWSDVKITVVAMNAGGKGGNDDSIVLKLEYEGVTVALTGDISDAVDSGIASKLGDCDILKVAHHGASSSSSEKFLSIVKPELSVISVGDNSYGHPASETVDRLLKYGTVYRTDEYGCVDIVINDGKYEVQKCTV